MIMYELIRLGYGFKEKISTSAHNCKILVISKQIIILLFIIILLITLPKTFLGFNFGF